jgi:hypothetical protein
MDMGELSGFRIQDSGGGIQEAGEDTTPKIPDPTES